MNSLNTQLLTLQEIFSQFLFQVPDYQRGYSWLKEQRDELLEDLELLLPNKKHYTGTLVLHNAGKPKTETKDGKQYELLDIVDGQQRLTTIVMLLKALRKELLGNGDTDRASGLQDYLWMMGRNDIPVAKLTLNQDCHDYFFDCLLKDGPKVDTPKIRSHQNIDDACKEFNDYFASKRKTEGKGYSKWVDEFRNKICQQLRFNVYTVDDTSDVGVIFEVMNDRGLKLTDLEKVKNYLLYVANKLELTNLPALVNSTWTYIFETLMRYELTDHEDSLLRFHWLMAYDPDTKNWDGSKSIKARFHLRNYNHKPKQFHAELLNYIKELKSATTLYCEINKPEQQGSFARYSKPQAKATIIKYGEKLRRLRVLAPFVPLLMAVRFRYPDDSQKYIDMVKRCEILSFRVFRVLKRRSNAGSPTLYIQAHKLYKGGCSFKSVYDTVATLIRRYSPQEDFVDETNFDGNKSWYHWDGIKYLLYEYEEHLSGKTPVQISWYDVESKSETIEHILPQTPPERGYWVQRFPAKAREQFTHDLGNLCLTFDNSSYSNKTFPEKKGRAGVDGNCYAKGKLAMEHDLCKYRDWSQNTLQKRRKQIVDWLLTRWPAPAIAGEEFLQGEIVDDDENNN